MLCVENYEQSEPFSGDSDMEHKIYSKKSERVHNEHIEQFEHFPCDTKHTCKFIQQKYEHVDNEHFEHNLSHVEHEHHEGIQKFQLTQFAELVLDLHENVWNSSFYNFLSACIAVPSGLNVSLWERLLLNYHDNCIVDF